MLVIRHPSNKYSLNLLFHPSNLLGAKILVDPLEKG